MESVLTVACCPRVVRGDKGTENVLVKEFQTYLRRNDTDGRAESLSYLEGRSTANQRIEYWWSFLRRECTDFWMCLFQQLTDDGEFAGTFLDVNLVQFCFMHIIQVNYTDLTKLTQGKYGTENTLLKIIKRTTFKSSVFCKAI